MTNSPRDAIVVGAGLAGMTAALRLARSGRSVLVIDRRPVAGGRCGAFELDGYRFTIGCNDFGSRIARDLAALGVHVDFVPSTNLFALGDLTLRMPPTPGALLRLVRHAPSIVRAILRVKNGGQRALGELFQEAERDGMGWRLLSLLAYALGTPPQSLRAESRARRLLQAIRLRPRQDGRPRRGSTGDHPRDDEEVVGARRRGAPRRRGARCASRRRRLSGRDLTSDPARARAILTTQPPPRRRRAGLKVAQLLFAVPKELPFVGARALVVSPPRADRWMAELDAGLFPETWGFHVFEDAEIGRMRTVTGFLLAPRGTDHFDLATRERLLADVERRIGAHVPGFEAALVYRRLLDPAEFEALHGVSPSLSHEIYDDSQELLPIQTGEPGLYRIGNAVGPPGDHANAAILSGLLAAESALESALGAHSDRKTMTVGHGDLRA